MRRRSLSMLPLIAAGLAPLLVWSCHPIEREDYVRIAPTDPPPPPTPIPERFRRKPVQEELDRAAGVAASGDRELLKNKGADAAIRRIRVALKSSRLTADDRGRKELELAMFIKRRDENEERALKRYGHAAALYDLIGKTRPEVAALAQGKRIRLERKMRDVLRTRDSERIWSSHGFTPERPR